MFSSIIWILWSYLCGSLPFSFWLAQWAGHDLRQYGDGNPGATNVLRAAGWGWFLLALGADISKAAVPVGLAYQIFGWQGWVALPIALAPALGHAYSPFLGWRGGKALAAMLGAWVGLTLWRMPLVLLTALVLFFALIRTEIWALGLTLAVGYFYLFLVEPHPLWLAVLTCHTLLILWTHRDQLGARPQWRFKSR